MGSKGYRLKLLRRVFRSPYVRLALWVAAISLMLYFALRDVRLAEVRETLLQADLRFVALALLSVIFNVMGKSARWRVLVGPPGKGVGFVKLTLALLAGQTLNLFLPGRVGELSRAYVIGGLGPGRTFILGTVAIEKVLDMISYALLFLLLVLLLPLPAWISDSGYTFSVVAGLVTLGLILLASNPRLFGRILEWMIRWLPEKLREKMLNRVEAGLQSLSVMHRSYDLLKLALLSVVIWGTAVWTNILTFQALGLQLPWTAAAVLLVVLQAGISVPSVPGRIGLFQYLCILSLGLFGISQSQSLSYGILLQGIVFILPTVFSGAALWVFGWDDLRGRVTSLPEKMLK